MKQHHHTPDNTPPQPPSWLLRLLRWFCHPDFAEDIEGDLLERYGQRVHKISKQRANLKLLADILSLFRPSLMKPITFFHPKFSTIMLRNYLKIGIRNLVRNRSFSIINISGLTAGMLVPILIGLWINDEVTFNQQFENHERLAAVLQNQTMNGVVETWWGQAMQLEPALRDEYGDYFQYIATIGNTGDHKLVFENEKFTTGGSFVGEDFPHMFSFQMLSGTRDDLQDPNALLLSRSTAHTLFGSKDPIGQALEIDDQAVFTVRGIYEDLPENSSYSNLSFVAPWKAYVEIANLKERVTWGNSWFNTLVQIAAPTTMAEASAAIKDVKYNHIDPESAPTTKPELFLHPIDHWNLYGQFENGVNSGGRIEYVRMFGIIAVFILLLACINFMNLSTAQSERRAKEVGIRKTLGSLRSQLIGQFFSESILIALIAFVLALLLATLLLPSFNLVAGKTIVMPWSHPWFWIAGLGFTLFTGLIAGSYPSLYLSGFRPSKVLRGTSKRGQLSALPRKMLVVVQFTVSVTLIIGTIFVYRQIQYAKDRPVGYNRDNLIRVPIKSQDLLPHFQALRTDLLNSGYVEEMAGTDSPVTSTGVTNGGFTWKGKDPAVSNDFTSLRVTYEFGKMVEWEIIDGRDFSRDFATDSTGIILNEAAVAYMGLENPVGIVMERGGDLYPIVGVVKNLVTQSPYAPVRQTIFMLTEEWLRHINIKLRPDVSPHTALTSIKAIYEKYDPLNTFEYHFADEEYARKFQAEERIGKLAFFFAALAIFISCLGLFGLVAYVVEQRNREIGIRKVLGATMLNLWQLLSKDFIYLVIVSCIVAVPLAYYLTNHWLENYNYRVELSWWVFLIAGLLVLGITVLTVSYQSLRAAMRNPIKAIQSE